MDSETIIRLADTLGAARGWSRATVSTYATKSGDALERLARGHDITTRRAARIVQWLSDHWPDDTEWPAGIPRPDPTPDPEREDRPGPWQRPARAAGPSGAPSAVLAATRAAIERHVDLLGADPVDWPAVERAEAEKFAAALALRDDGQVAAPDAVCLALGVSRDVYQDVVRRYADEARNRKRPRRGSQADRMLTALVVSGDARFASRRQRAA